MSEKPLRSRREHGIRQALRFRANDKLAEAEWNDVGVIFPGEVEGHTDADHLRGFLTATGNPYSVLFSLGRARDNARAIREALSLEIFVTLNET